MSIESASNFFVGSILYTLAIVIIIAGITVINNIISKFWKPVKIWLPHYFAEPQRFATPEEVERIAPTLNDKK